MMLSTRSNFCDGCGSTQIQYTPERGEYACMVCGLVIDDHAFYPDRGTFDDQSYKDGIERNQYNKNNRTYFYNLHNRPGQKLSNKQLEQLNCFYALPAEKQAVAYRRTILRVYNITRKYFNMDESFGKKWEDFKYLIKKIPQSLIKEKKSKQVGKDPTFYRLYIYLTVFYHFYASIYISIKRYLNVLQNFGVYLKFGTFVKITNQLIILSKNPANYDFRPSLHKENLSRQEVIRCYQSRVKTRLRYIIEQLDFRKMKVHVLKQIETQFGPLTMMIKNKLKERLYERVLSVWGQYKYSKLARYSIPILSGAFLHASAPLFSRKYLAQICIITPQRLFLVEKELAPQERLEIMERPQLKCIYSFIYKILHPSFSDNPRFTIKEIIAEFKELIKKVPSSMFRKNKTSEFVNFFQSINDNPNQNTKVFCKSHIGLTLFYYFYMYQFYSISQYLTLLRKNQVIISFRTFAQIRYFLLQVKSRHLQKYLKPLNYPNPLERSIPDIRKEIRKRFQETLKQKLQQIIEKMDLSDIRKKIRWEIEIIGLDQFRTSLYQRSLEYLRQYKYSDLSSHSIAVICGCAIYNTSNSYLKQAALASICKIKPGSIWDASQKLKKSIIYNKKLCSSIPA